MGKMADDVVARVRAVCESDVQWSQDPFRIKHCRDVLAALDAKDAEIERLRAVQAACSGPCHAPGAQITPAHIGMVPVEELHDGFGSVWIADGYGESDVWDDDRVCPIYSGQLWREGS